MNNLTLTKRIFKNKYLFRVELTQGSKNCEIKQYTQDVYFPGIITDDLKEIRLLTPLCFNKGDKSKSVDTFKIPKENLVEVVEMINNN